MPKINHKRLALPFITKILGLNITLQIQKASILIQKQPDQLMQLKYQLFHDVFIQRTNLQKILSEICNLIFLKKDNKEVDQDMKDNLKCVKTPRKIQQFNDTFIE